MFSNIKWSHEPVIWVGVLVVVAQAVQAYMTHTMDLGTAINSAVVALGTLIARKAVTPNAKLDIPSTDVPDGSEEVSQDPDWWKDDEVDGNSEGSN